MFLDSKKNAENQKLEQIIRTGKNLFWKYGIKRVTVEEICREAGVSKMTFYKHFRNKTELVKRILTRFGEESMAKYRNIMERDIPYEEKIKGLLELKRDQTREMSLEFYGDYLLHADPELSEYLVRTSGEIFRTFMADLAIAQKRGDIRQDIKPEFILYFLNRVTDMAHDEELLKLYDSPQELAVELFGFFLYGVMPRNKKNSQ